MAGPAGEGLSGDGAPRGAAATGGTSPSHGVLARVVARLVARALAGSVARSAADEAVPIATADRAARSRPGVRLAVGAAEAVGGDVGVALGRGQGGVAEQLLHRPQVGAALEEVGGGGVP